jgi:hypothetical protein
MYHPLDIFQVPFTFIQGIVCFHVPPTFTQGVADFQVPPTLTLTIPEGVYVQETLILVTSLTPYALAEYISSRKLLVAPEVKFPVGDQVIDPVCPEENEVLPETDPVFLSQYLRGLLTPLVYLFFIPQVIVMLLIVALLGKTT